MFGIRYKVLCPKCKQMFVADHGITPYFRINRRINGRYCQEDCTECGHKFFKLELDEQTYLARVNGLSVSEAIEERLSMIRSYRKTDDIDVQCITNLVTDIYSIPEQDICIDLDSVSVEDLVPVGCCCY